ncbi:AMP-binding protein [Kordiimonas aestuarii]|uniref:AMP-binding protein n=1 Tax=Kordiimonas aestuarii TaxID=1005925 RepID=UPI0021CE6B2F|nr:AMP-binding protein [Kordiimonas aestuarii]
MSGTPSKTGRLAFLERFFGLVTANHDQLAVCNLDSRFQTDNEPGSNLTYAMLARNSCDYAQVLAANAAPGSIALLAEQDHTVFTVSLIACWIAGIVPVPCPAPDSDLHRARLKSIIAAVNPSLVLSSIGFQQHIGDVETLTHEIGLSEEAPEFMPRMVEERADDTSLELAVVQFSSGSTSSPKGISITFDNITSGVEEIILGAIHTSEKVALVNWLPLFHDMGLIGSLMTPLMSGGTCYGASPKHFIQRPQAWLAAMSRVRATAATLPNFGVEILNRKLGSSDISELDLSSLTDIFCGAEPISAHSMSTLIAHLEPHGLRRSAFRPCFGMAEGTLMISVSRKGQPPSTMPAAVMRELGMNMPVVNCGPPVAPGLVKILGEGAEFLSDYGVGEICIAGRHVSPGLVRAGNPQQLVPHASIVDSDGQTYLRTSDIGYMDGSGLFILDRQSNMISVNAQNIGLADIERTMEHWFQQELDALGYKSRRIISCLIINFGNATALDLLLVAEGLRNILPPDELSALRTRAERYLAGYFGIRISMDLEVTKSLPRTSSGKLGRGEAAHWYQANKIH